METKRKTLSIRVDEEIYNKTYEIVNGTRYPLEKILTRWVEGTDVDKKHKEFVTSVSSGGG